jgi:predicted P-loop ATPase/GTPase
MSETQTQQQPTLSEALKKVKRLLSEVNEQQAILANIAADYENESPVHNSVDEQKKYIETLEQSINDKLKEAEKLQLQIAKTNVQTQVTLVIDGKRITKSLNAWIWRRRIGAPVQAQLYKAIDHKFEALSRGEKQIRTSSGQIESVKVRRYYEPAKKDKLKVLFGSEPKIIDEQLEDINATTRLISLED